MTSERKLKISSDIIKIVATSLITAFMACFSFYTKLSVDNALRDKQATDTAAVVAKLVVKVYDDRSLEINGISDSLMSLKQSVDGNEVINTNAHMSIVSGQTDIKSNQKEFAELLRQHMLASGLIVKDNKK